MEILKGGDKNKEVRVDKIHLFVSRESKKMCMYVMH